jgi:hypothetical protein
MNLSSLIDYNKTNNSITSICLLIIDLIVYSFKAYNINYEDVRIRKFEYLINSATPHIDENIRIVGSYQDLVNSSEIDDEQVKNEEYTLNEENTALDIDDFVTEEEDGIGDYNYINYDD